VKRLLVLVALVGCKDFRERATPEPETPKLEQDEEVFPDPPPGPVGLRAGRYEIVSVGATVGRRNPRGIAWDLLGGAAADPKIEVLVNGEKLGGCTGAIDTPKVVCAIGKQITIDRDTTIRLVVSDTDLASDEPAGEAVAADLLGTGRVGVRMKLKTSEKVTSAFVELVKLPDPPSAWAKHRWRVLGAAGGVGLAFLVMLLFRGALFRRIEFVPPPRMPAMPSPTAAESGWTCSFCQTGNGPRGRTCFHCGARRE
jgi:hypothetical protein